MAPPGRRRDAAGRRRARGRRDRIRTTRLRDRRPAAGAQQGRPPGDRGSSTGVPAPAAGGGPHQPAHTLRLPVRHRRRAGDTRRQGDRGRARADGDRGHAAARPPPADGATAGGARLGRRRVGPHGRGNGRARAGLRADDLQRRARLRRTSRRPSRAGAHDRLDRPALAREGARRPPARAGGPARRDCRARRRRTRAGRARAARARARRGRPGDLHRARP